jgi:hypothetical protein
MARWHSCNVLQVGDDARRVWQFDARNGEFALNREQSSPTGEALPDSMVKKDWRSIFGRAKLNVAWLPPENVFLRVAQFPQSSFEETRSMVEFQLEKLSPIPITQIVWTLHTLPQAEGGQQTVIVTIAARSAVEAFLGELEGQGYLADRLEVPMLDQLQAAGVRKDGAWIYPAAQGGRDTALVAWWEGGVLRNLDVLVLPPSAGRMEALRDQLTQTAWAGELEGWLQSTPQWHLVADGEMAREWEPTLRAAVDQPVNVVAPLPAGQLAALTARRATHSDPAVNLMPPEFATRYQQQFMDRLWMRGLFAVIGLYVVGVAIYLVAVQFLSFKTEKFEAQVKEQGPSYTNSLQLIAKHDVLKQRQELKYAALDCYLLAAANLPDTLSLESLNFSDGKRVGFAGTGPAGAAGDALSFWEAMGKAEIEQKKFFKTASPSEGYRADTQGGTLRWNFALDLSHTEDTP